MIDRIVFEPTKTNAEKGTWLANSHEIPLPANFTAVQQAIVHFNPGAWAANHRHKRREILLGISGDLYFI